MTAVDHESHTVSITGQLAARTFATFGRARFGRQHGLGGQHSGDRDLERVHLNLTRRASRALDLAAELTGDSRTDSANRALQFYAYLAQVVAHGGNVYVREGPSYPPRALKVF